MLLFGTIITQLGCKYKDLMFINRFVRLLDCWIVGFLDFRFLDRLFGESLICLIVFNLSIFQSFNLSIFQSFNLSIFQFLRLELFLFRLIKNNLV
ncbi:hypothetical protein B0A66_12735 [Flavobacterium hercynium]|uniref:Uncharacterized protein n=1 Tax=Flavobacterium hercynium TaxID=387094 RepID=A0A226H7Z7_9FLAO|nr:hypothetical protein B0A66_12735 [Flavobacterium hercynium]